MRVGGGCEAGAAASCRPSLSCSSCVCACCTTAPVRCPVLWGRVKRQLVPKCARSPRLQLQTHPPPDPASDKPITPHLHHIHTSRTQGYAPLREPQEDFYQRRVFSRIRVRLCVSSSSSAMAVFKARRCVCGAAASVRVCVFEPRARADWPSAPLTFSPPLSTPPGLLQPPHRQCS